MKILVIDAFPSEFIEQLRALPGAEVEFLPDATKEEVYSRMRDVEILVMNSKVNADAALLEVSPCVKVICRAGVGLDHFDVPLLESKGIKIVSTPGANKDPVAEQAIGMLLCLMHNIARANTQVKQFIWQREENRGTELKGKTVGIIGYGNTGSAVAEKLSGFGCRVLAFDKYKSGFGNEFAAEATMDQIFESADVVTLHVPLTDETLHLADEKFFSRFRKNIWFLNLSRGPVLSLDDLISALRSGKVIAAGIDVLENEKFNTLTDIQRKRLEELFTSDKVIFTPHIGGWSHESLKRINDEIVEQIKKWTGNF